MTATAEKRNPATSKAAPIPDKRVSLVFPIKASPPTKLSIHVCKGEYTSFVHAIRHCTTQTAINRLHTSRTLTYPYATCSHRITV